MPKGKQWANKVETVLIFVFVLYFIGVSTPLIISKAMNALSYPVIAGLILRRFRHFSFVAFQSPALLILILFTLSSFIWSVDLSETISDARGLLRTTAFGIYISTRYSLKQQIRFYMYVFIATAILSLWAVFFLPTGTHFINGVDAWRGVFPHKNFMSRVMAIGSMLCLNLFLDPSTSHKLVALLSFFLCVILIIFSAGKSAMVISLLLLMILPLYTLVQQKYKLQVFLYGTILVIISIVSIIVFQNIETIIVDILGKDMNLNGRIPLWKLCFDKIFERPFLGYGYSAFFSSEEANYILKNTAWSQEADTRFYAHNGYIGILLGTGFLGLFLLSCFLIETLRNTISLIRIDKNIETIFALQFLVFIFTYNLFDGSGLVTAKDAMWMVLVSLSLSSSLDIYRKKQLTTYAHSNPI